MSRRVCFGASIVFITLCLQLFFSGAAFAASPDNAAAEKLCYRAIDKMELFLGYTPEPCSASFDHLMDNIVLRDSAKYISSVMLDRYEKGHFYWMTDRELKKEGITRHAKSITNVDFGRKTPNGDEYRSIVVIEDHALFMAGGTGSEITFYLGWEVVGIGPFKRCEWRIVDMRVKYGKCY